MSSQPKSPSYWMIQAIEASQKTRLDVPVGCLITKNGELVASAYNEREEKKDPVGHAEIVAIRKASQSLSSWRLDDCVLYSTLEPCPMCAEAIIQTRIAKVFFGAFDPKSGACGSAFNLFKQGRIYPVPEVIGGIEEQACQNVLKSYFAKVVRKSK